jgi:hypothetical protein
MTFIRRLLPGLLLATLPGALAAQDAHGLAYSAAIVIDSGGHKNTVSMRFEVLGTKFRMSTKADIRAGPPLDMYMVIDSVAGTFTTVMPAQAMATVTSLSMLKSSAASSYTMDFDGKPNIDVVDLGAGEPILGHPTRHYRQTAAYISKTTMGANVCTNRTSGVTDFWATGDVAAPDMLASMRRFLPVSGRGPLTGKLDSIRIAEIKGVVLRQVATGTVITAGGDTINVRSSWELTELKPGSADPKDFEIPPGYNVMDMRDMMANADPEMMKQAMETAQSKLSETLKKTLCGRGGS